MIFSVRDSTPTRRAAFVAVREPTCVNMNKDASAHWHPPTAAARSSARLTHRLRQRSEVEPNPEDLANPELKAVFKITTY
ncbi:MAG: hypothetical protein ABSF89_16990 [Acidimicrobiales bacterium]